MTFDQLQQNIGVAYSDPKLLHQAFVHRSYLNEAKNIHESNERMEFLGDAVLSFLTSDFLYRQFPEFPEGKLTNIRSSLVNTKTLSEIATSLNLGELLFLSHGEQESGGRNNSSLLADAFESLLGSMYLDGGIDICRTFLSRFLFIKVAEIIKTKAYVDYKSFLQEIIQEKSKISPLYQVVKSQGPDHLKTFWVAVFEGEKKLGEGQGKSKQEAEQMAARLALAAMSHS